MINRRNSPTFSMAQLARKTGDVMHAASRSPVMITQHRKPRYVLMTVEDFMNLAKQPVDPRQAYRTEETPPEVAEWLLPALDKIARGEGFEDESNQL